jgi:small subunit ribosomal protein S17
MADDEKTTSDEQGTAKAEVEETPQAVSAPEAPVAPAAESPPEKTAAEAAGPAEPKRKKKRLPRAERRRRPKPKRDESGERKQITRLPKPEGERGRRQERRGVVVSNAMDKTIVVKVDTIKAHRKYQKVVRRSQRFHAHDEQNSANVGDLVRIVETRPLSKSKHWRLAEIVEAAR